jgi:hypothetical protein
MRTVFVVLLVLCTLIACTDTRTQTPSLPLVTGVPLTSTPEPNPITPTLISPDETATVPAPGGDFFTQMGITLPVPACVECLAGFLASRCKW